MKEVAVPVSAVFRNESFRAANARKSASRWNLVLFFSTAAGVLFGLIGLVMSGIAYFVLTENSKTVNQAGTWLIVAAFPLMIFGAHALDKIKENEAKKH